MRRSQVRRPDSQRVSQRVSQQVGQQIRQVRQIERQLEVGRQNLAAHSRRCDQQFRHRQRQRQLFTNLGQAHGHIRGRDGQALAVQTQCVGGFYHRRCMVAVIAPGVDGFGPIGQVIQRVRGQLAQRRVHLCGMRQVGIENLLTGPGGFTKVTQTDHARAALEGVEGPAQAGQVGGAVGCVGQVLQARARFGHHFTNFFDEDLAHFGVVFKARVTRRNGFVRSHRDGCRRRHRRRGGRRGQTQQVSGQCVAHGLALCRVFTLAQRAAHAAQGAGQAGLVGGDGLL